MILNSPGPLQFQQVKALTNFQMLWIHSCKNYNPRSRDKNKAQAKALWPGWFAGHNEIRMRSFTANEKFYCKREVSKKLEFSFGIVSCESLNYPQDDIDSYLCVFHFEIPDHLEVN